MAGSRTPDNEASSDVAACDEITKPLRRFRCESIGFDREVLLAFSHRGRQGCSCAPAPSAFDSTTM
jgi:hypothetical protein